MAKVQKVNLQVQEEKGAKKGQWNITLKGELTIDYTDQLQVFFKGILDKHHDFSIRLIEVKSLDLSFLQCLWAFIREVNQQKKSLTVDMELDEDLRLLLQNSGFERLLHYKN